MPHSTLTPPVTMEVEMRRITTVVPAAFFWHFSGFEFFFVSTASPPSHPPQLT
jgi:hypothetical protein